MSINDPLGRIEALEHEQRHLKEEVRKLKEQRQTEPIALSDSALLQTLVVMAGTNATDMALLKGEMGVLKSDVAELRADMQKRFDSIAQVQNLILSRLPEKGE